MPKKILRLPAVQTFTGLSKSTIYNRIGEKSFPEPISLGDRAVGWIESEIHDWIEQRIKMSRRGKCPISDPQGQGKQD